MGWMDETPTSGVASPHLYKQQTGISLVRHFRAGSNGCRTMQQVYRCIPDDLPRWCPTTQQVPQPLLISTRSRPAASFVSRVSITTKLAHLSIPSALKFNNSSQSFGDSGVREPAFSITTVLDQLGLSRSVD